MNIHGAVLYDPVHEVHGEAKDIYISGGRISAHPGDGETIKADGLVAMPGAIDIHTHISSTRNRKSGFTAKEIADLYLSIGYTHIVEAGVAPSELDDFIELTASLPIGCSMLELAGGKPLGENRENCLAKKYVGERGVELFFAGGAGEAREADEETYPPPHIHLPRLASTGSFEALTGFIKKLDGRRCHISHIAYYIFGDNGKGEPVPKAKEAAEFLMKNKNATFDLGPPTFGRSLAFTADTELAARVARSVDSADGDGGGGIDGRGDIGGIAASRWQAVEYEFKHGRYIDSIFWLSAMELILELKDFSRASLSIDFPSGGSIEGYPFIIASLMSAGLRREFASRLNKKALAVSGILANERELTFGEVAMLTRSSPALACGFSDRGHLGIGADADVVLYRHNNDLEKMFRYPAYVIKKGVVVKDGKPV
jgi:formylmethanofuran dehydrogenase subunit A